MIRVKVIYQDNYVKELHMTGHANYSEYGSDIVCAGVSSLALSNLMYAESKYAQDFIASQDDVNGSLHVEVYRYNYSLNELLEATIFGLNMLAHDYQQYLKINILEV